MIPISFVAVSYLVVTSGPVASWGFWQCDFQICRRGSSDRVLGRTSPGCRRSSSCFRRRRGPRLVAQCSRPPVRHLWRSAWCKLHSGSRTNTDPGTRSVEPAGDIERRWGGLTSGSWGGGSWLRQSNWRSCFTVGRDCSNSSKAVASRI